MKNAKTHNPVDQVLIGISDTLQTLFTTPKGSRAYPGQSADDELTESEKQQSAGYMRVNHVGEICAQALYQSQAMTASSDETRIKMQQAAAEETDHLAWCAKRLDELGSRQSYLNPLWYAGSFAIGTAAGITGDKWNLGFVAETERQVVKHLESHLSTLPEADLRSREIVSQMRQDEADHAQMAVDAGAKELPRPIQKIMQFASGIMTRTAYWI